MGFFGGVRDKGNLEQCVTVLAPEDRRAEFDTAFRRFAESMDMLLPDPKALDYAADLAWLGKIRLATKARYRAEGVDISDCGDKVRKLIEDSVAVSGMQILVQAVNIFSGDFDAKLRALGSDEAKASEMEHAVRHEIHIKLEEDPAYFQSLRERLEQIIEDRKQQRIDAAEQLSLLQRLVDDVRGHSQAAAGEGMSEAGYAIYGLLKGVLVSRIAEGSNQWGDERLREVAAAVEGALQQHITIVDWTNKNDVQRDMRRLVKRALPLEMYGTSELERLGEAIVDLLKVRQRR
jgi:type I restriction enzyme R subunit